MSDLSISRCYIYIAFFFFTYPFISVLNNFTLSDFFIVLALIGVVSTLIGSNILFTYFIRENEFIIPLVLFSIGVLFSINRSIYLFESFTAYLQIAFIFLIGYPVLRITLVDTKHIWLLIYIMIVTGMSIAVIMMLFYIIGVEYGLGNLIEIGWKGRLSYGQMEPNVPARILLQIIPLCFIAILRSKRVLNKIIFITCIAIVLLAVFLTASRSSLLIVIIGSFFLLISYIKMAKKINFSYLILFAAIQLSLFYYINTIDSAFYKTPVERYTTIIEPKSSPSSLDRLQLLDKGIDYIAKNPFLGLGLENSNYYTGRSIHNPIVLTWVENGILGMLGFVGIYAVLFIIGRECYRKKYFNDELLMAFVVMTGMMVLGDMFMANSYKRFLWLPSLLMMVRYRQCISNIVEQ